MIVNVIEKRAVNKYITENPHPIASEFKKNINEFSKKFEDHFKALEEEKKIDDEVKEKKIEKYIRMTFADCNLSENEILQLYCSVMSFVKFKTIIQNNTDQIKKNDKLKQGDIKNFVWNIANQYKINPSDTTSFLLSTFANWFENTESDTLKKKLQAKTGNLKIKIDENLFDHIILDDE